MSDLAKGDVVYLIAQEDGGSGFTWPGSHGYQVGETFRVTHVGDEDLLMVPCVPQGRTYEDSGIYVGQACVAKMDLNLTDPAAVEAFLGES